MAQPNLAATGLTANAGTAVLNPTNTMTDLIVAASGHAVIVEAVRVCNIHATERGWVTLVHKTGGVEYPIEYQYAGIAPGQTVDLLLGRGHFLAETESLRVQVNAASNFTVTAPKTDIS